MQTKRLVSLLVLKSCLVSGITLLTADIALTQNSDSFGGMWRASESDGLIMDVQDSGQSIRSEVYSGGFDHAIEGKHTSSVKAYITIHRKNISTGCETRMYGTWSLIGANQLRSNISGTDGRCDLPTNFQETRIWNRM